MAEPLKPERASTLYGRDYYLSDCDGFEEFLRTSGKRLPRRLEKCLGLATRGPHTKVVDVGCGRGELALHLAARGTNVIAIDPAREALEILGEAMTRWSPPAAGPTAGAALPLRVRALGEELPVATEWADAVILSDVVEHLKLPEIRRLLREALRVLERGGRLIVHTQPNRTLLSWTVPVLSRISRLWGVRLPSDLRCEMTRGSRGEYHASEQSWGSLRKALVDAGFEIGEMWLEGSYAVHRIFGDGRLKSGILRLFRKSLVLKKLLATQLFAVARKPPETY